VSAFLNVNSMQLEARTGKNTKLERTEQRTEIEKGHAIELVSVGKRFGGIAVLSDVDISLREGELVGMIGPNGAGKSTALNIMTGAVRADSGTVRVFGCDVTGSNMGHIGRLGVARTFQTPRGIAEGTVLENIVAPLATLHAQAIRSIWKGRGAFAGLEQKAMLAAELCGLAGCVRKHYGEISGGEARMVDVARALVREPRVLLLDEPTAGLDSAKQAVLSAAIEELKARGVSILIVEHNLEFLLEQVPEVVVLSEGRVLCRISSGEVASSEIVREAYFGNKALVSEGVRVGAAKFGSRDVLGSKEAVPSIALNACEITGGYGRVSVVNGVSLSVEPGKGVALLGPNGAGKSTLLRLLAGALPLHSGELRLNGAKVQGGMREHLKNGIFWLPQEKVAFSKLSVFKNLELVARQAFGSGSRKVWRAQVEAVLDLFPELRSKQGDAADTLSGGQRQMLGVAAAWISQAPVLLLDEPTSGLAPAVVERLCSVIKTLIGAGRSVVWVIEQSPEMALDVVDRVDVMVAGEIVFEGTRRDLGGVDGLAKIIFSGKR